MFNTSICKHPGCKKTALSVYTQDGTFNEGRGFCFEHIQDKDQLLESMYKYVLANEKIVGLTAIGMELSNVDFDNKKLYGCNFQNCKFFNIKIHNFRARMCMFDFSTIADCSFLQSNVQFTSFAGCTFSHVLFTGSDLISCNFTGVNAYQSSFDDTDLYNSRFIRTNLQNTSMRNCNLKKTIFYDFKRQGSSFKLSNTREALFSRDPNVTLSEIEEIAREDN